MLLKHPFIHYFTALTKYYKLKHWAKLSWISIPGHPRKTFLPKYILPHCPNHAALQTYIYAHQNLSQTVLYLSHLTLLLVKFPLKKPKSLSCVQLFVSPWTVAHQAHLSVGILQAGKLEWVASLFSRGSSLPKDRTQVSHTAGGFCTIWATNGLCLLRMGLRALDYLSSG